MKSNNFKVICVSCLANGEAVEARVVVTEYWTYHELEDRSILAKCPRCGIEETLEEEILTEGR